MTKCKACGAEISSAATACPKCGDPQKKKTSGCAVVALVGIVLMVALAALAPDSDKKSATSDTPSPSAASTENVEPKATEYSNDQMAAFVCEAAKDAVLEKLKAPATADFPGCVFGADQYTIRSNKEGTTYSVEGHVDAENSFGAKIRSRFGVILTKNPGGGFPSFTTVTAVVDE